MAISALSPVSNALSFIQPPLPSSRVVTTQELFSRALEGSLSGPPASPAALAATVSQPQLVSSLERALFRDLALQVGRADGAGLTSLLDPSVSSLLGLGGALPNALPPILASASMQQSLAFTASLTTLFNTIQLLGSEASEEPSLVDLLA
jgi:hypothetical protein